MFHSSLRSEEVYLQFPYLTSLICFLSGLISGAANSWVLFFLALLYLLHTSLNRLLILSVCLFTLTAGWTAGTWMDREVEYPFSGKSVLLVTGARYLGGKYFSVRAGRWHVLWKGSSYTPQGALFIRSRKPLNERAILLCSLKKVERTKSGFHQYLFGERYSFICNVRERIDGYGNILTMQEKPSVSRGLVRAVVYGEKFSLEPFVKELFRRSGISHLLAISGFHLMLLYLFAYSIIRGIVKISAPLFRAFTGINLRRLALLISLIISFLYLHIAGYPVSALRAFFVLCIYTVSEVGGMRIFTFEAISLLAFCFLSLHPGFIYSASFTLSFLAFAGIVLTYERYNRISIPISRWLRMPFFLLMTTLSAVIFTMPATLIFFHTVNLAGVFSNFIGVPAFYLLIPLSISGEAIPFIKPFANFVIEVILKVLIKALSFLSPLFTPLVFNISHPGLFIGGFVLIATCLFTRRLSSAFLMGFFALWGAF